MKIYEMANKPGRIFISKTGDVDELTKDLFSCYAAMEIDFPEFAAFAENNLLTGWHDLEDYCHLEPLPEFPGAFRWVMGAEAPTEMETEEAPVDEQENSTALYYERMEMELSGIRCR